MKHGSKIIHVKVPACFSSNEVPQTFPKLLSNAFNGLKEIIYTALWRLKGSNLHQINDHARKRTITKQFSQCNF